MIILSKADLFRQIGFGWTSALLPVPFGSLLLSIAEGM